MRLGSQPDEMRPMGHFAPLSSPSLDCEVESDQSSASTSTLMSFRSNRSGGSRHSHHGQCHREIEGHMKINLQVFKDEDMKDTSPMKFCTWTWWCTTMLVVKITPLCYPLPTRLPGRIGEKFQDRHHLRWCACHTGWTLQQCQGPICFEPGALSTANGQKRDGIGWGVHLLRHLQVLAVSFPECFPPDHSAELKHDHFYGGQPKRIKAMVAYLKASANEKTYSDYLCAVQEAEKEEEMEPSHSQMAATTIKPMATSFFSLLKLKGSHLVSV